MKKSCHRLTKPTKHLSPPKLTKSSGNARDGYNGTSLVVVLFVMLLGIGVIAFSLRGIQIKITMEP